MKILKHGSRKPRKFICSHCDCEFVAGTKEYCRSEQFDVVYYTCYCPECDYNAAISEPWEEEDDGPGCVLA